MYTKTKTVFFWKKLGAQAKRPESLSTRRMQDGGSLELRVDYVVVSIVIVETALNEENRSRVRLRTGREIRQHLAKGDKEMGVEVATAYPRSRRR